jgi:hypothetical protein
MRNKRRLIIMRNTCGQEEVIFTEDYDICAEDFCNPNFRVVFDNTINMDMPTEFPTERNLRAEN